MDCGPSAARPVVRVNACGRQGLSVPLRPDRPWRGPAAQPSQMSRTRCTGSEATRDSASQIIVARSAAV